MLRMAVPLLLVTLLLAPVVSAQSELGYEPVSPVAQAIESLYEKVYWAGLVIGVIVEALLVYTVFKWRKNRTVPKNEVERGHTVAEIAWTAIPAIVLVWIGILTLQTMQATEIDPPAPEFYVQVEAQQFYWSFTYPDGTTSVDWLRVEEGAIVGINVTSRDVQHAFWVRELGVKLDAYPDRVNRFWFQADKPGTYVVQCAELCGAGHGYMRGFVQVFPRGEGPDGARWGGQPVIEGRREIPTGDIGPGPEFTIDLQETAIPGHSPWSIGPPTLEVTEGDNVHLTIINRGASPHNFSVMGDYQLHFPPIPGGATHQLNFTAIIPGEFEYICAVPGHAGLGMTGRLIVNPRA